MIAKLDTKHILMLADFEDKKGKLNQYLRPIVYDYDCYRWREAKQNEIDEVFDFFATGKTVTPCFFLKTSITPTSLSEMDRLIWQDFYPDYGISAFANSSAKEKENSGEEGPDRPVLLKFRVKGNRQAHLVKARPTDGGYTVCYTNCLSQSDLTGGWRKHEWMWSNFLRNEDYNFFLIEEEDEKAWQDAYETPEDEPIVKPVLDDSSRNGSTVVRGVPQQVEWQVCPLCQGTGVTPTYLSPYAGTSSSAAVQCPVCNGSRIIPKAII